MTCDKFVLLSAAFSAGPFLFFDEQHGPPDDTTATIANVTIQKLIIFLFFDFGVVFLL